VSTPVLARLRRAPWLAGALLLVLAAGLVAPAAWLLGVGGWPLYVGLIAIVLLVFGSLERLWLSLTGLWLRRAARRKLAADRDRFRVVQGGKRKGNGHGHDSGEGQDGPGWVM